jgi:hypothetical protein
MKLIKIAVFSFTLILFSACEKENTNPIAANEIENQKQTIKNSKSSATLADDIIIYGNYLNERNNLSGGDLSDYMNNNPNATWQDMENLGYLDASTASDYSTAIQNGVTSKSDSAISNALNQVANEPGFDLESDGGNDPEVQELKRWDGFVIIRWKIGPGKNCFQMFIWENNHC